MAKTTITKGKIYLLDPTGKSGLVGADTAVGICVEAGCRKSTFMCTNAPDKFVVLPNKYVIEIAPGSIDIASKIPVYRTTYPVRIDNSDLTLLDICTKSIESLTPNVLAKNPNVISNIVTSLTLLKSKLTRCVQAENDKNEYEVFYRTLNPFNDDDPPPQPQQEEKKEKIIVNNDDGVAISAIKRYRFDVSDNDKIGFDFLIDVIAKDFFNNVLNERSKLNIITDNIAQRNNPRTLNLGLMSKYIYEMMTESNDEAVIIPFVAFCPSTEKEFRLHYRYFNNITKDFTMDDVRDTIINIIDDNLNNKDKEIFFKTGQLTICFEILKVAIPVKILKLSLKYGYENILPNIVNKDISLSLLGNDEEDLGDDDDDE